MDLWIRSQDRNYLFNGDEKYYIAIKDRYYHIYYSKKDNEIDLGEYGSYEDKTRALEILDEIHQRLINLGALEIAPDSYKILPKDTSNVYEMPKE